MHDCRKFGIGVRLTLIALPLLSAAVAEMRGDPTDGVSEWHSPGPGWAAAEDVDIGLTPWGAGCRQEPAQRMEGAR